LVKKNKQVLGFIDLEAECEARYCDPLFLDDIFLKVKFILHSVFLWWGEWVGIKWKGGAVDSTLCWEFNFFELELSMIFFWYDVCVVLLTEVDPEVTLIDIRASFMIFFLHIARTTYR